MAKLAPGLLFLHFCNKIVFIVDDHNMDGRIFNMFLMGRPAYSEHPRVYHRLHVIFKPDPDAFNSPGTAEA